MRHKLLTYFSEGNVSMIVLFLENLLLVVSKRWKYTLYFIKHHDLGEVFMIIAFLINIHINFYEHVGIFVNSISYEIYVSFK